jgi:hypothetical protein
MHYITTPTAINPNILAQQMLTYMNAYVVNSGSDINNKTQPAYTDTIQLAYAYIYTTKSHTDISEALEILNNITPELTRDMNGQSITDYKTSQVSWHTNIKIKQRVVRPWENFYRRRNDWLIKGFMYRVVMRSDNIDIPVGIIYDPEHVFKGAMSIDSSDRISHTYTSLNPYALKSKIHDRVVSSHVKVYIGETLQIYIELIFNFSIVSVAYPINISVYYCDFAIIRHLIRGDNRAPPNWWHAYVATNAIFTIDDYNHIMCYYCGDVLINDQYVANIRDHIGNNHMHPYCKFCIHNGNIRISSIIRLWRVKFLDLRDVLHWLVHATPIQPNGLVHAKKMNLGFNAISQAECDCFIYLYECANIDTASIDTERIIKYNRTTQILTIGDKYIGLTGGIHKHYELYDQYPGKQILLLYSLR